MSMSIYNIIFVFIYLYLLYLSNLQEEMYQRWLDLCGSFLLCMTDMAGSRSRKSQLPKEQIGFLKGAIASEEGAALKLISLF